MLKLSTLPQLDETKQQIRVLRLDPGPFGRPLRGRLEVVDLRSGAQYEALSYTWGETTDGNVIALAGERDLKITDNLSIALQRLRYRWTVRTLWVDAICINQDDPAERSGQVLLMGEIYASALRVCVWLGNGIGPSAFQERRLQTLGNLNPDYIVTRYNRHNIEGAKSLTIFADMLQSALQGRASPWHTRAWVYQEHLRAKEVLWCCGRYQRCHTKEQFDELCRLAHMSRPTDELRLLHISIHQLNQPLAPKRPTGLVATDPRLGVSNARVSRSLHAHAYAARGMHAKHDCDRVYSLYGVVGISDFLKPDYTKPCWWAYAQATHANISIWQDHSVLLNAACSSSANPVRDLPTWAFDYRDGTYYSFSGSVGDALQKLLISTKPPTPRLSVDHKTLSLTGMRLDKIVKAARVEIVNPNGSWQYSTPRFFRAFTNALGRQHLYHNLNNELWPDSETMAHFRPDGKFLLDATVWHFIVQECSSYDFMPDSRDRWANIVTFFVTETGMHGIMPTSCSGGDLVFVKRDCPWPIILRKASLLWLLEPPVPTYVLQGCAYMPALLDLDLEEHQHHEMCTIAII